MKEYTVLHSDHYNSKIENTKYFWKYDTKASCYLAPIKAEEAALNFYAKEGWHLVQAVALDDMHVYLYLERELGDA